jgi:hypothetical protein
MKVLIEHPRNDLNKYNFLCSIHVAICYKHGMFKYYQYAINDFKVCDGMWKVSITGIQFSLQKIIIWIKKVVRVDKNEQRLVGILRIALEIKKIISRLYLLPKLLYPKRPWSLRRLQIFIIQGNHCLCKT